MSQLCRGSRRAISKPIDIGRDGTVVSADPLGTIYQLAAFHPEHGLVLAEPYPQFDGTRFHDPTYVRAHRARMLDSIHAHKPGFGLRFDLEVYNVDVKFEGLGRACVSLQAGDHIELTTRLSISDNGELIQSCNIVNNGSSVRRVRYQIGLGISINRASYGQLTEGGPIALPDSRNELGLVKGGGFSISNPHLGGHMRCVVLKDNSPVVLAGKIQDGVFVDGPVHAETGEELEIPAGSRRLLEARFCLRPLTVPLFPAVSESLPESPRLVLWKSKENQARFIVRRNLEYILGNCAIPLPSAPEVVCLITDHVALPLGWNRDNYWQARFLLDVHQYLPSLEASAATRMYSKLIKQTVKGHLTWVFRCAQRPRGYWHRSYLVTGRPKDGAVFQLDQQCYPLLLLCDFLERFSEERAFVTSLTTDHLIPEILEVIGSKRDPLTGLFTTEETPGDDPVEYPFHFSSQVLLWYTFLRLSKLLKTIGVEEYINAAGLEQSSETLRSAAIQQFLLRGGPDSRPLFAYVIDGDGAWKLYHDANDIPTLLAESWGFVKSQAELEVWQNTMKFAFSAANEGGYYEGQFGGLGSVHTRGPWPLGYFQMWKYAQMSRDRKAEREAWEKICGSMQWDGLFPEAVNVETGECTSKAWFSWPGAMIGSGLLHPGVREQYCNFRQD